MYRFSRSIYRELAPYVESTGCSEERRAARIELLEACERTIQRLACDGRYFAKPAKTLFEDVRSRFPIGEQRRVLRVIEANIALALEHLAQLPTGSLGLDGEPLVCQATTRKGKPCQREPLPGRQYCPSHKHLEELEELEEQLSEQEQVPLAA